MYYLLILNTVSFLLLAEKNKSLIFYFYLNIIHEIYNLQKKKMLFPDIGLANSVRL
jgi:hypothetical protein